MERKILIAPAGKVLMDGEIFGKVIYLAEGVDESRFYETGEGEYERMLEPICEGGSYA